MKFAINNEHRKFFQKNGWVEFKDFVSSDQIVAMNQEIDHVLADRLGVTPEKLKTVLSDEAFSKGHDLWRGSPLLSKYTLLPRFAEIATELLEKKPLRLGYDQLFPPLELTQRFHPSVYSAFLNQEASLESTCCLTGVACGLIFTLGEEPPPAEESKSNGEAATIFSRSKGHAVFFLPSLTIQWNAISIAPQQRYYLIVYTHRLSLYTLQPADPHTHWLKQLGYVFNEKLRDRLHPIVYR